MTCHSADLNEGPPVAAGSASSVAGMALLCHLACVATFTVWRQSNVLKPAEACSLLIFDLVDVADSFAFQLVRACSMELRAAGTEGTAVEAVAVAATVTRIKISVASKMMTAGRMVEETEAAEPVTAAKAARVDTSPLYQLLALSAWRRQGLLSPG